MKAFSLEGHAALVTGSSRGIGLAIATGMAEAGARVVRHGHEPAATDSMNQRGGAYVQEDLTLSQAPARLMEAAFKHEPELDLLVCNAGAFFDVPFLEMTPERWEQTISLNLRATYFLIQAFALRLVQEGRSGSVVITASTNGLQAERHSTAYDTSKGGLVMMTRTLALELAAHNIRVNAIAPGLIVTPLTEGWLTARPEQRQHYERSIPAGRIGTMEECAGAAVFLLSPAAAYVTGHILVVDGGLTISQVGNAS